ncbi:MAG: curli production assembly/transport component CsgG [SAR86 cluster bacterium SAR86A]|uniref:Curli production assembly/transport component CsgG n=1 Tax=SAR86 cluster bacterium SAR86A TaxID=1123866 RepID=J4WTW6_9GAMM|nr:MAG: curli production assembly/transport component CsgG [SAR86 cluster bacterium SAR86A]
MEYLSNKLFKQFTILNFIFLLSINVHSQDLPVIAITEIESSVDSSSWLDYKNSKSQNFQTMLETQLVQTKRFKIIERNRIDEVLSEQILQGEFSNNNTRMNVGGVDYIVYGSITKFGSKTKQIQTSGVSVVKLIAEFGVDLKVVDVLTGEIIKAETIDISLETGSGTSTNSFGISDTLADPLSDIQRTAAKSSAALIAESIFPIKLITWEDELPNCCGYLNYGDAIMTEGDIVRVIKQGTAFVDPDTGLKLGSTEKTISKLQVVEVLPNFSKAKLIEGENPIGGELIRFDLNNATKSNNNSNQRERLGKEL